MECQTRFAENWNLWTHASFKLHFKETHVTAISTKLLWNYGKQTSLFNIWFICLNIAKCVSVDFVTCADIEDKECEKLKIPAITDAQFNCLTFLCGMRSASDAGIRSRILSKIAQYLEISLLWSVNVWWILITIQLGYNSRYLQQLTTQGYFNRFNRQETYM